MLKTYSYAILCCMLLFYSCNSWQDTNQPSEDYDKYIAALALSDQGKCVESRDLLNEVITNGTRNDDIYSALGWAQLCLADATAAEIADTLYRYIIVKPDLTVIGRLADKMLPMNSDKLSNIGKAIETFNAIQNEKVRNLLVAVARLVKGAAILANQATLMGMSTMQKTAVARDTCSAVSDCTVGGCVNNDSGPMSDGNILEFAAIVTEAVVSLRSTDAANLLSLAVNLQVDLPVASAIARCFIYRDMIPN